MVLLVFIVFIILIAYVSEKLKNNKILDFFLIILISFFIAFNRGNYDYDGYVAIFEDPESYAEPGYVMLVNCIKYFGVGGHESIVFILGTLIAVTFFRYSKYLKSMGLLLVCYFIFPFPSDIVQIRNTFSMFFLLNSLIEYNEKKYFRGHALLAIGLSFHYLGFIYILPLFFLSLREKKYYLNIVLVLSFFLILFMPLILTGIKMDIEKIRNVTNYLSEENKLHSLIIWGIMACLDLIVFSNFIRKMKNCDDKSLHFIMFLKGFMTASLVLLAGMLYIDEFNRVFRTVFVIKYILAGMVTSHLIKHEKIKLSLYVISTSFVFGLYYANGIDYSYIIFTNYFFQ